MIKKHKYSTLFYLPFIAVIFELLFVRVRLLGSFSLDLNGLEYYFIHIVQKIAAYQPIYQNPEAIPFDNCLYTPLYFYICRLSMFAFTLDYKEDILKLLVLARGFSLLFVLMQLFYLAKITRLITKSLFQTVIVITFYLLLITEHMYAARPDSLKILFFTMFLFHFINYFFVSGKILDLFAFFLAGILAILSKQDIIIYLGILFATLILFKKEKRVLLIGIYFAITLLAVMFVCYLIYGNYFFVNIFLFNFQSVTNIAHSYIIICILISLSRLSPFLLLTFYNLYKSRNDENSSLIKYISINIIITFAIVHLFSMHRAGSNLNYSYELIVLAVLSIPIFYTHQKENTDRNLLWYNSVLITGVVLLFFSNSFFSNYKYSVKKEEKLKAEYITYQNEKKEIINIIKNDYTYFPNTKYCLFYFDNKIIYGHDMHLDRFINYYIDSKYFTNLDIQTKLHFINTSYYDESFKNGLVKFLITDNTEKSSKHVALYYPKYSHYKATGNMIIYKFNESKHVSND